MFDFNKKEIDLPIEKINRIYVIDIQAIGYVRRTRADKWKKRPIVMKYYHYKNLLSFLLNRMNYKQEKELNILFLLPIPQSLSSKKREELHLTQHNKKPDLDNLVKAFLDTATKQDNYISKVNAVKLYSLYPKIIIFQ